MKKSVYSLVLSDDVVAAIDRLAYERGTNRSGTVNRILAEYVSYVTPEKRIHDIFDSVQNLLGASFQTLMQPSDTLLSLRSALVYKYNPTLRYSVEMYRDEEGVIGELRVSLRTQNSTLILCMMQFYKLWARMEQTYVGAREYSADGGKFSRKLLLPKGAKADADTLGEMIASYIRAFDNALKAYFFYLNDPQSAILRAEEIYREYLRKAELWI